MSNILFVLYHDFRANSAVHVHNFANQLAAIGHATAVAIPEGEDSGASLGEQNYSVRRFAEVDGDWARVFENGRAPDVVHAWTPRENVRLFCEKLAGFCAFALFVHLEDNEELILEVNLGASFEELARSHSVEIPPNLSHPRKYRGFIASAAGVTMIMDRLDRFVPPDIPKLVLWPGADEEIFFPRPRDNDYLDRLGIEANSVVLCYTGNVHSANARDVRSLYLAAAILDREGTPATLVRTGRDFCPFLGPDEEWARRISIDLGYVEYKEIARVLSLADVLIQPGADNPFNEYRLPGKLPEFFAMGRPVIVPETNIGRFVRHGEEAWVLPKVDALNIVEAVQTLRRDQHLRERLGAGALDFRRTHFDWKKNTVTLDRFYRQIREAQQKAYYAIPAVLSYPDDAARIVARFARAAPASKTSYATVRDYCESVDLLPEIAPTDGDLKNVQRPWAVKTLLRLVPPPARLLEIGGGEPIVSGFLSELGYTTTLVDPYDGFGNGPTDYERYVELFPNVKIVRGYFEPQMQTFPPSSFDAILSVSVLEHLPIEAAANCFRAIAEFLAPGGASVHCFDFVLQGVAQEYDLTTARHILEQQAQLENRPSSDTALEELIERLTNDLETFYLSPQGHHHWRGGRPYDDFPFRKVVSLQTIAFRPKV